MRGIILQLWLEEKAVQEKSCNHETSWSSFVQQSLDAIDLEVIVLEVLKDSQDKDSLWLAVHKTPIPEIVESSLA